MRTRVLITGLVPRLLLPMGFVIVLVGALMTLLAARRLESDMRAALARRGTAVASSIALATEGTWTMDPVLVQSVVDAHRGLEGVKYIFVEDRSGEVLVHTFSPAFPEALRRHGKHEVGAAGTSRDLDLDVWGTPLHVLDVAAPISAGALGDVHVGMDRDVVELKAAQLSRSMIRRGALVAAVGLAAALLSVLLLVIRPLRALQRATAELAEGADPPRAKLPVGATDEIGQLARSFADMVEKRRNVEREREALLRREQEARAEAVRASGAKDQFLATLSHELRTPLSSILMQAQLLLRSPVDDPRLRRGLESIERSAKAQAQLVSDLLDVSRIAAGKLELTREDSDVAALVRASIDMLRPLAEARQLAVELEVPGAKVPVHADRARIQQVLWNLLTNAIKFTPPGGRIRVTVDQLDQAAHVTVSDTGKGISPEFVPHLFERFSQQDATTTRRHGGLGLGLAIVHDLVALHGGTVEAHSEGEGRGSTFKVSLPVAHREEHAPARPGAPQSAAARRLAGARVLVVDDDPDIRDAVTELLARSGMQPRAAASAAEAERELREFSPDVILCDLAMPGEDGLSFLRRLRQRAAAQGGGTPAIALTAVAGEQSRRMAMEAGFDQHLAKPVDAEVLIEALSRSAAAHRETASHPA